AALFSLGANSQSNSLKRSRALVRAPVNGPLWGLRQREGSMLRRIGVLTSLAVAATMFAGIASAQAQVTVGACVFEGLAGTLNPGIQDAVPDILSLNPLDTEQGDYTFSTGATAGATCAGLFDPD